MACIFIHLTAFTECLLCAWLVLCPEVIKVNKTSWALLDGVYVPVGEIEKTSEKSRSEFRGN